MRHAARPQDAALTDEATERLDAAMLDGLQKAAFDYFPRASNPRNGLVADTTRQGSPASIAVVGFALSSYPVAVEHGWMERDVAVQACLGCMQFFWNSDQTGGPGATGYKGFYFHFLDIETGARAWQSELSLIDTTLLMAGILTAAAYFDGDTSDETQLRELADRLYRRVDWRWAQYRGATVAQGWKPECGFLHYGWEGYSEAILLYVLGLGSPTHPLAPESFEAWTLTYQWENLYGYDILYAGPLFIHQFSHAWIDFRGIRDRFMREKRSDYFENSRRATYVQREYAIRNPHSFVGYGENCWGLSAGDGPSAAPRLIGGRSQRFFGYAARGVPYGPDDGTIAVTSITASLAFAPEIALAAMRKLHDAGTAAGGEILLCSGVNATFTTPRARWTSEGAFGLDQGMTVLMIENYRSGLPWKLGRRSAIVRARPASCRLHRRLAVSDAVMHTLEVPTANAGAGADLEDDLHERALQANVRPAGWINPTPGAVYPLLIIGAGPCGLAAAHAAAAAGVKVALIERHRLGGASLSYGCVPSKAMIRTARLYADMRDAPSFGAAAPLAAEVDFRKAMERLRGIRARASRVDSAARLCAEGVDLYFGVAHFVSDDAVEVGGERVRFKKALIATGSRSIVPEIAGLTGVGYLTNLSVFNLTRSPRSLLVIGGGPLGCELAQAFSRLGVRTVIAHNAPLFLPKEERDAAQLISDALARDGVEIHLNSDAISARMEHGRKVVELVNDGQRSAVVVDEILTGIGHGPEVRALRLEHAGVAGDPEGGVRVDEFLRTSNPRIYAAGDACREFNYSNMAVVSARLAVRNALCLGRGRMSTLTIPRCTYTDPEVAHIGLSVRQARERRIPVKTFTAPMHDNMRAIADGEETGFVKIHIRDGTDTILGATIVARHAGEMINGISLAMVAGIGLGTLATVTHAHPTQGEAIKMAGEAYLRTRAPGVMARLLRAWARR